jgi:hypothetical protein
LFPYSRRLRRTGKTLPAAARPEIFRVIDTVSPHGDIGHLTHDPVGLMNFKRGFFRLWLCVSVGWLITVGAFLFPDARDAWEFLTTSEIPVPISTLARSWNDITTSANFQATTPAMKKEIRDFYFCEVMRPRDRRYHSTTSSLDYKDLAIPGDANDEAGGFKVTGLSAAACLESSINGFGDPDHVERFRKRLGLEGPLPEAPPDTSSDRTRAALLERVKRLVAQEYQIIMVNPTLFAFERLTKVAPQGIERELTEWIKPTPQTNFEDIPHFLYISPDDLPPGYNFNYELGRKLHLHILYEDLKKFGVFGAGIPLLLLLLGWLVGWVVAGFRSSTRSDRRSRPASSD